MAGDVKIRIGRHPQKFVEKMACRLTGATSERELAGKTVKVDQVASAPHRKFLETAFPGKAEIAGQDLFEAGMRAADFVENFDDRSVWVIPDLYLPGNGYIDAEELKALDGNPLGRAFLDVITCEIAEGKSGK